MKTELINRIITLEDIKNLQVDLDSESLTISLPSTPELPIVYWHIDEVEEDANVAFSMLNAVHLFHTDRQELLTRLGWKILTK
jgi:hypothetical protein